MRPVQLAVISIVRVLCETVTELAPSPRSSSTHIMSPTRKRRLDTLFELTGSREMDATAILEYFAPLQAWLQQQNQGQQCGW